jgi:hypothetical protein
MKMKQITETEWYESAIERFYCLHLCQLPYSVEELENMFSLSFFEYIEDGLGLCYGSYIKIEDKMYFLMGFNSKMDKELCVLVQVKNYETNLADFLNVICKEFEVSKDELLWVNSESESNN